MLAKLFDFPWDERHKLTYWSDMGGNVELMKTPEDLAVRNAALFEMGAAFAELWQRKAANPGKEMLRLCSHRCPHMHEITLEQTRDSLKYMRWEIDVPEDIRVRALRSVERMLAVGPKID